MRYCRGYGASDCAADVREPKVVAESLVQFLEIPLNVEVMTQQVDATLYRQRSKGNGERVDLC